jgi:5-methylcytosine-specific restriction endonuclease McrA
MADDYRNTKYCPELNDVKENKQAVVKAVKIDHPRAVDMHTYISPNDGKYKSLFMKVYNCKCAYCGVSIDLVPKGLFEVDHFLYKESSRFKSKKYAGNIDNLVLSCHDCNHRKSSFNIADTDYNSLYPDGEEIKNTFCRDEKYYIKMSAEAEKNDNIKSFYEQLKLGGEVHRLDYLLMNLIGFQREHEDNSELYIAVGKTIDILRQKRNMM